MEQYQSDQRTPAAEATARQQLKRLMDDGVRGAHIAEALKTINNDKYMRTTQRESQEAHAREYAKEEYERLIGPVTGFVGVLTKQEENKRKWELSEIYSTIHKLPNLEDWHTVVEAVLRQRGHGYKPLHELNMDAIIGHGFEKMPAPKVAPRPLPTPSGPPARPVDMQPSGVDKQAPPQDYVQPPPPAAPVPDVSSEGRINEFLNRFPVGR